ncbi:FAD/NAD(P)-binding domain-containing protein [Hortaea werneckii]|nr:FAD/NAD(P)-binding domain-containing protein [Hortaea werneckii]KAI7083041.1 FAD/NAD(P)-binding domain-containing protein [Hortaea werneckii]KAI7227953.1 FAD/NAD(P)-binding domain-containing protein [Hortaea werneckii]KAI7307572.1 FAD/NAD(P)-binding domain-containing protein [Hortaea werneckii]KAI7392584.1 FAD/NAD(P)-binding domain-containing protein [Hortaea werneckii]
MAQTSEPSVLIIGAGIFGTSTAYHLSLQYKDPSRITVLDRTPSPPEPAASNDINKIIRADYSSPFYCDLAYEALDAWATWPELKDFYYRTGWIMLDEEGSDLAERIRKVFRDRNHDPTEDVKLSELNQRWKGVLEGTETKGFKDAYWNPEAGWCDAAAATSALMRAAIGRGVNYAVGEVAHFHLNDTGIGSVELLNTRHLFADKFVVSTGAWTSSLLSPLEDRLNIAETDRIEQQASAAGVAVAHYRMSDTQMTHLSEMPVVVYGGNGEVIPPPAQNRLLKFTNSNTFTNTITTKSGHRISVPLEQDQHIVSSRLRRETEQTMVDRVMPTFARGKEAAYWRLCWDARTPTQDWLLDRHPDPRLRNLFLAVGGSFHSYKFLPTAGKYMANVLLGRSNGVEKDEAWAWKSTRSEGGGAHPKTAPKRELKDVWDDDLGSRL